MAVVTGIRQPRGTAFALRDSLPWSDFAGLVRDGESLGYRAVFLPEISGRDAFAALTGLAGETNDLLLGTGVVPMTSRTPRVTAMGAATVQERSGGRMILGLGTGAAGKGVLDTLAAQIDELRALLGGESSGGGGLSLPFRDPMPVWIAALGPRAVALAGRKADGVLLNWCSPERVAEARVEIRRAAEGSGRDPETITIAVYIRAAVGVDPHAAVGTLKRAFGEYASYASYARQFAAMGMGDEAEGAAGAFLAGRPDDIPDALIHRICLVGDPADAGARLQAYRDAGADLPVVYPALIKNDPVGSLRASMRVLAPHG